MSQLSDKSHFNVEGQRCIYCGDPAEAVDHVPPQVVIKRWRLPLPQEIVPTCQFCNRELGSRAMLLTVPLRKAWMAGKIWKKRLTHKRRQPLFTPPKVGG